MSVHPAKEDSPLCTLSSQRRIFYVHLDRGLLNPATDGYFLEVKSRTWSRRDSQDKAAINIDLLDPLGPRSDETVAQDYVELK